MREVKNKFPDTLTRWTVNDNPRAGPIAVGTQRFHFRTVAGFDGEPGFHQHAVLSWGQNLRLTRGELGVVMHDRSKRIPLQHLMMYHDSWWWSGPPQGNAEVAVLGLSGDEDWSPLIIAKSEVEIVFGHGGIFSRRQVRHGQSVMMAFENRQAGS